MITIFEEYTYTEYTYTEPNYTRIDLGDFINKNKGLYSQYDNFGDKVYFFTKEIKDKLKEMVIGKVISFTTTNWHRRSFDIKNIEITDLILDVAFYENDEEVEIIFKTARNDSRYMDFGKITIWDDDSEMTKDVKLKIEAEKYNL